jgi:hypothetical protein
VCGRKRLRRLQPAALRAANVVCRVLPSVCVLDGRSARTRKTEEGAMALKRTSPEGKVYQLVGTPVQAYLYDFDIDGATPKPAHLRWLNANVVQPAKVTNKATPGLWFVWVYGNASRTGDDAHNLDLSGRRALAVYKHLEKELAGILHVVTVVPQSEGLARQHGWDDDTEDYFYRSVAIVAGFYAKRPPVPPPPPPPPPSRVRKEDKPDKPELSIRVVKVGVLSGGISLGLVDIGTSRAVVHFEILDKQRCEIAPYTLEQQLADISWGSGVPIPETGKPEFTVWPSPTRWQDFETTARANAFEGWGRIIDVDQSELTFRLSRDNALGFKGPKFTFKNPRGIKNPVFHTPSISVASFFGRRVSLAGKVHSCKK